MIISAPGKLFLAGEWAILELGNPGIVAAIDRRVFVEIEKSEKFSFTFKDVNLKNLEAELNSGELIFSKLKEEEKEYVKFVKSATETTLKYLDSKQPLKIKTWSKGIRKNEIKIGFGSSAAISVAVVAGILKINGYDIRKEKTKEIIYKLSTISHFFAQKKLGSAFDVAASTYGGIILYYRFDPDWLVKEIENFGIKETINKKWPYLKIERLKIPKGFNLIVGWTEEEAKTSELIKKMNEWKKENREIYEKIMNKIKENVEALIIVWKKSDRKKIIELLRKNEEYLRELTEKSGIEIETKKLRILSEIANSYNAAGKLSGAGGGDCGIAICFDKKIANKIKKEWKRKEIISLNVKIDNKGVCEV
jgi:phosphomevalonate kinase